MLVVLKVAVFSPVPHISNTGAAIPVEDLYAPPLPHCKPPYQAPFSSFISKHSFIGGDNSHSGEVSSTSSVIPNPMDTATLLRGSMNSSSNNNMMIAVGNGNMNSTLGSNVGSTLGSTIGSTLILGGGGGGMGGNLTSSTTHGGSTLGGSTLGGTLGSTPAGSSGATVSSTSGGSSNGGSGGLLGHEEAFYATTEIVQVRVTLSRASVVTGVPLW